MRSKLIFFLLLLSTPLLGQIRLHLRNPEEVYAEQHRVVGSWCRQDFLGYRLTPEGWEKFKPFTSIKDDPDTTIVVVISRYQIEEHNPQSISWDVPVTYFVLGRYEGISGYVPKTGTETVTFTTKDIDGDIVITGLDPHYPYVSKKAAIEWMKQRLKTSTSDVERFHLNAAIRQLEPAPPAPSSEPAK